MSQKARKALLAHIEYTRRSMQQDPETFAKLQLLMCAIRHGGERGEQGRAFKEVIEVFDEKVASMVADLMLVGVTITHTLEGKMVQEGITEPGDN